MARQPTQTQIKTELDDVPTPGLPEVYEAQKMVDQMTALEESYSADRDLLNRMLGRREMAGAISKFLTVTDLSILQYIKEAKLYRASKGIVDSVTSRILDGTWADFCVNVIGKSVEQVDEDLRNLNNFGEAALEKMQQAGIGYRELRQFRKFPADEKTALIEAAKDGDKDALLDLAETLIAKHAKEKTDLLNENNELKQNYEAQGKVLEQKDQLNNKLAMQLNTREKLVSQKTPDDIAKELRSNATGEGFRAEHTIANELGATFRALFEHALDHGGDNQQFMLGIICQIETEVLKLREEFNLNGTAPDSDPTPDWLKPDTEEELKLQAQQEAEWDAKMHSPEWENHPAAIEYKANKAKNLAS